MKFKLFDGSVELGTVTTDPFDIELTQAGRSTTSLAEYQTPQEITMMEGEVGPDRELSLEEDWVEADNSTIQNRLSRLATLKGWNIVPESELSES